MPDGRLNLRRGRNMIAKYNGYCQYENKTKCGGIHKGQRIVHVGKGDTYHPDCATRTTEEISKSNFEGAFLMDDFPNYGGVVDAERFEDVFR
jgi:hypothetical protein